MPRVPLLMLVASTASLLLATGCGLLGDHPGEDRCGIAACGEPGPQPNPPTPDEPSPSEQQPAPSVPSKVQQPPNCFPGVTDGFENGAWSNKWDEARPPMGPGNVADAMEIVSTVAHSGQGALSVHGQGNPSGYAPSSALMQTAYCFPQKARFAFDYRIDDGSLDQSRDDHAEIGSISARNAGAPGVGCALLIHVRQGRLTGSGTRKLEKLDFGAIEPATWTRLEFLIDGSDLTVLRDGKAVVSNEPLGCEPQKATSVRVSVSGGRSLNPGSYHAFFDGVVFEQLQ